MDYNDIKKLMQEDREAFNSLSTSEKLRIDREGRVASLLKVDYITSDEAQGYREQLTELPQDRKGLVVAYFLLGVKDHLNEPPTMETSEKIAETIASFRLRERGALQKGKTIADTLTEEERNRWVDELTAIHTREDIKRAETFVDSKRKRLRSKLLKFLPLEIALSLSAPEPKTEEDLDSIPHLREVLQENGYKGKGKSLSDGDKKAIEAAALHYLDLIELAFLSGIGLQRYEEYKAYRNEDEWTETLLYRDNFDEALTEYETIYLLLDNATANFYADGTPKEALDFLSKFREELLSGKLKDRYETLKGGKFSYLLEEEKQC